MIMSWQILELSELCCLLALLYIKMLRLAGGSCVGHKQDTNSAAWTLIAAACLGNELWQRR